MIITDSMSLFSALRSNDWRDTDPILAEIKEKLQNIESRPTLLWVPSHCRIPGNDRADKLADMGTKLSQKEVPVTGKITRARIKREKWGVGHYRAARTFKDKRQPRTDIEKKWPRKVRSLYARLRSGHSKELSYYSWLIEKQDDPSCKCGAEKETIEQVIAECPLLDEDRRNLDMTNAKLETMVKNPEASRKLLMTRFPGLQVRDENSIEAGGT